MLAFHSLPVTRHYLTTFTPHYVATDQVEPYSYSILPNLKLKVLSPDLIFIFGGWVFYPTKFLFCGGGSLAWAEWGRRGSAQPKLKILNPDQILIYGGGGRLTWAE